MKTHIKLETILKHGKYEIIKATDTRFGSWHYGMFYNRQWREWSWDFDALKQKIFSGYYEPNMAIFVIPVEDYKLAEMIRAYCKDGAYNAETIIDRIEQIGGEYLLWS